MKVKFFIGVFFVAAISGGVVIISGGRLSLFIDVPTLLVILVIPAAIAFASWPVKDIGRAFSAPFDADAGRGELEKSRLFFESLRQWILAAALLGTMVGLVSILAFADAKNLDKLGRNLAVMLLCLTNSLFLFLILPLPFEALAKRRLAELN
ncbi:MAG: hypothetical protein JNG85_05980 [Spirochaetaceae bacterium]|nr:hypothetical protein [Spirochaetaceae bacterium]